MILLFLRKWPWTRFECGMVTWTRKKYGKSTPLMYNHWYNSCWSRFETTFLVTKTNLTNNTIKTLHEIQNPKPKYIVKQSNQRLNWGKLEMVSDKLNLKNIFQIRQYAILIKYKYLLASKLRYEWKYKFHKYRLFIYIFRPDIWSCQNVHTVRNKKNIYKNCQCPTWVGDPF